MLSLDSVQKINLKLLLNVRRYFLLAAALMIGSVALIGLAIKPQVESILAINKEINQERQYFEDLTQKLNELKHIEFSAQFEQKDKVDQVLPSHKPILEILFNLSQASRQHGIIISELNFSPGEIATESAQINNQPAAASSGNPYSALQIDLTIEGRNDDLGPFITTVERIAPISTITDLKMGKKEYTARTRPRLSDPDGSLLDNEDREERPPPQEEEETVTAELALETYYYTNTIITKVDDKLPSVGDDEVKVFETIQKFMPTEFEQPSEIQSSDIEDLFDVEGFDFGL